jgi:hypothetical protein
LLRPEQRATKRSTTLSDVEQHIADRVRTFVGGIFVQLVQYNWGDDPLERLLVAKGDAIEETQRACDLV